MESMGWIDLIQNWNSWGFLKVVMYVPSGYTKCGKIFDVMRAG
jgi:hypothetical protein